MKAIILAAGMGKRTGDYGDEKPKCLFQFQGKETIVHQLESLRENGIMDVVIVVGYKKEQIVNFLKSRNEFDDMRITLVDNPDYETTNTSYSWWLARDYLRGENEVIHFNSDLVFFPELVKNIVENENRNVVYIDKEIELNDSMEQVVLGEDEKILHMDKANVSGAQGKGVGVAKFSREAVDFLLSKMDNLIITKGDKGQNFYGMIRMAVRELDFYGLDIGSLFFREYNSSEDFERAVESYSEYSNQMGGKIKAVILAAGKGSRLKEYTENQPTGLLKVDNKPILEFQLEALKENGVKNIFIVIGYKGFMIKDFISNNEKFKDLNVTYIENDEYRNSGTAYSWSLVEDFIKDDTLMLGALIPDVSAIGFYKAAFVLASSVTGVLGFSQVLMPLFVRIKKKFNKALRYSMILAVPAAFGIITLGTHFLVLIYGHEYIQATLPLYFLAAMIILGVYVALVVSIFQTKEKLKDYFSLLITVVITNIILNYVLIKYLSTYSLQWGIAGAAIATITSWLFYSIGITILAKKKLGLNVNLKTLVKPVIASIVMVLVILTLTRIFTEMNILTGILLISSGVLVYILSMALIKGLVKEDVLLMQNLRK